MEIEIIPVAESILPLTKVERAIEPVQSELVTLEDIFAKFLQLEVGDGAASEDTICNYLSQTKQYLDWCKDNLLAPIEAEPEDIKLYRQYLVQSEYANSTIATKLNIVRIFYNAVQAHGLITSNPAAKVKAPKDRKDPAASTPASYFICNLTSRLPNNQ